MAKGRKKERSAVLKSDELVVQRLSSTVTGKAQKYSRVGPREFVSFPHEEMTIQNIKSSCEKHFTSVVGSGLACDVLAGDQGPSCQSLDQLPDTNLILAKALQSQNVERAPFPMLVHRRSLSRHSLAKICRRNSSRKVFPFQKC